MRQGSIFSKSNIQENEKKHISNSNFKKRRKIALDNCIINIHTKFEQDRTNNEASRLGKLKVTAAAGTAAAAAAAAAAAGTAAEAAGKLECSTRSKPYKSFISSVEHIYMYLQDA